MRYNPDSNLAYDSRQPEKTLVHPATARWLKANGYTYDYEVAMPEYGRVDFLATHADGHKLLIECKFYVSKSSGRQLVQLLDYQRQMTDCRCAFAVPRFGLNDYVTKLCVKHDVMLIVLDVSRPHDPKKADKWIFEDSIYSRLVRDEQIRYYDDEYMRNAKTREQLNNPSKAFIDILDWCTARGKSPTFYWLTARNRCTRMVSIDQYTEFDQRCIRAKEVRNQWSSMMLAYAEANPDIAEEMMGDIDEFDADGMPHITSEYIDQDFDDYIFLCMLALIPTPEEIARHDDDAPRTRGYETRG